MALTIVLSCIAVLLGLAVLAAMIGLWPAGVRSVYAACLTVSLVSFACSLGALIHAPATAPAVTLPLGLPWLGVHLRMDALSAFFLAVVNLGAAAASLFAFGSGKARDGAAARAALLSSLPGRHEPRRPCRRCFHLPERLGVHVADLVGAGHGASSRAHATSMRATSISSWQASARSRCCSPSACSRGPTAATRSMRSAQPILQPDLPRWCSFSRCSAPDPRPGLCRCMSGCRSRTRRRQAMSRP